MGALTYHDLAAMVGLRINALSGTDAPDLQVTYTTRPLTDADFISSIFPFAAIRDAILNAEQKLANAIGFSADRTLRAYLRSETDALASGADLPSLDADDNPIIGNFGAVLDGTVQTQILTRKPVATVLNYLRATGIFLVPVYNYAMASGQILHTRTTAILECCVYNGSTQAAAFDNDDTILLPDSLAEAYICGALAMLVRDDEFLSQSTQYAGFFATELAAIPRAVMEQQGV